MRILFVRQNFPGQFKHLAPALARCGHEVRALAIDGSDVPDVKVHRYRPTYGSSREIHPWAREFETKMIRGEACGTAALALQADGFEPNLIANPGWGESLFLKDVWPRTKLLALLEFYYVSRGLDCNFDPEFAKQSFSADAQLRAKNAYLILTLDAMDHGVSPTYFQRSTLPQVYRDRVAVIFDGIDTDIYRSISESIQGACAGTVRRLGRRRVKIP